jgi:hypothetical protein
MTNSQKACIYFLLIGSLFSTSSQAGWCSYTYTVGDPSGLFAGAVGLKPSETECNQACDASKKGLIASLKEQNRSMVTFNCKYQSFL